MAVQKKKRTNPSRPRPQRPEAPEVVYTQPEIMDRKKLLLRLLTVAAVVLALFIGCSIFFRVENIVISGNEKYSEWTIREVSGIEDGESLLTFSKASACGKIVETLPYVDVVRIGIKLPGTVNIYIEEVEMVYSIQDEAGGWWLMTSGGRLVEKTNADGAAKHAKVQGVVLQDPKAGKTAVAFEPEEETTEPSEEETVVVFTNEERLRAVWDITDQLEHNEIIGKIVSIDVTEMGDIQLWYGEQYQILLGDPVDFAEKIQLLKNTVANMGGHQTGILDLTFTTTQGAAIYKPFS